MQMPKQAPTLPKKVPAAKPWVRGLHHNDAVSYLVGYEQFGLHAVIVERFEQAIGSNGSPTRLLACVD